MLISKYTVYLNSKDKEHPHVVPAVIESAAETPPATDKLPPYL